MIYLGAAFAYAAGFGASVWLAHDDHPGLALLALVITGSIRFSLVPVRKQRP